jgi:hypothetical protein
MSSVFSLLILFNPLISSAQNEITVLGNQANATHCFFGNTGCAQSIYYAPDPDFPEHTPNIYIKYVFHVFQKPSSTVTTPPTPAGPNNFANSPEDIEILKSFVHDPAWGCNAVFSNICPPVQDPLNPSQHVKDIRYRAIFDAIVEEDLFFYEDFDLWRGVPSGNGNGGVGGTFPALSAYEQFIIDNNPKMDPASPEYDLNIVNAIHIYLPAVEFNELTGNYSVWEGGLTSSAEGENRIVLYSLFDRVRFDKGLPPPIFLDPDGNGQYGYSNPSEEHIPIRGFRAFGETHHLFCVNHTSANFHNNISLNGDGCDDTPFPRSITFNDPNCVDDEDGCEVITANYMQTGGAVGSLPNEDPITLRDEIRCEYTQCQAGRLHFFALNNPLDYARTAENNFAFPRVTAFCSVSQPDIVIPSGYHKTWEGDRELRTNVIIENGASLTIRCSVGFPEGACIVVRPGGKLVIDGARLFNNCNQTYWNGIIVQGDGASPQGYDNINQTFYQGFCQIKEGSIIENALTAIQCQHSTDINMTGGYVQANGAIFRNCKQRMVYIRHFNNTALGTGQATGNLSRFTNCRFVIDEDYVGSFVDEFDATVRLENVDGVNFYGCEFENNIPNTETTFADDRQFAIYGYNAGFGVFGKCKGITAYPNPCPNMTISKFSGFNRAILASNSYSQPPIRVVNAQFRNNVVGIDASKADNSRIEHCTFEVGSILPLATPDWGSAANRGIMLLNSSGYTVQNNTFILYTAAGTTKPIGILTTHSGEQDNTIEYNTYSSLYINNLSNGMNRSLDLSVEGHKGLEYLCNTYIGTTGYDVAVPEEIGPGTYGIKARQGSLDESAGNKFTVVNTSSDPELHIYNRQNQIDYFYANQSYQEPTEFDGNFVSKIEGADNGCLGTGESGLAPGILTSSGKLTYWGTVNNSHQNTTDEFTFAADQLIAHFLFDSTDFDLDSVSYLLGLKGDLYSLFRQVDLELMREQHVKAVNLMLAIPNKIALTGEKQTEYNLFEELKALQLTSKQQLMSDSALVALSGSQIEQLARTGNYYAAVQALSLLNATGAELRAAVILPNDPQQAQLMMKQDTKANPWITLYPNPAQHYVDMTYRLPTQTASAYVVITDLTGTVLERFDVSITDGHAYLDLIQYKNGVYMCSLFAGDRLLSTKPLVIQR